MKPEDRAGLLRSKPLLTLAIPTFNRATYLAELLEALLPQLAGLAAQTIELLISDNCSEDETAAMVAAFQRRGLPCRYVRNPRNIGSDANFLQCLNLATGQYVWVMGDDDLLVPHAIADLLSLLSQEEFDLIYLSSFGFSGQYDPHHPSHNSHDKLGRYAEVVTDGDYFLEKVNALIGLISVNIVNKDRLLATPHPPIESLNDSNLMQTGWLFPLIHRRCRILYVWERLLAYRSNNSTGWGAAEVFGIRLQSIAKQYFAAEPILAQSLMNGVLRYWLFEKIFAMRRGEENEAMNSEDFARILGPIFRNNWRYWVFVYPVAELPLPLAKFVHGLLAGLNKLTRIVQAVWRHLLRRSRLLRP